MNASANLPPGQYASEKFPRFGLLKYAYRFPQNIARIEIELSGDVRQSLAVGDQLARLTRVEQRCDFHCVTTWTRRDQLWSGYRFADFYREIVAPLADPLADIRFVVLRGQDGYHSCLPLADMMAPDVLLADRLDGEPLPVSHGAPLRLIAPAHYGYKNVKHICAMEFLCSDANYRPAGFRFMAHPRARVDYEERGRGMPGWLYRYLYRPLIAPDALLFERSMARYLRRRGRSDAGR